ncbi:MAG TPA: VIT1/CCC1 transporter family protein [Xanthomonadales bacterium]|nr:VIT1/CCC1 transporter family protein [Xanthomonadales bacterium]
MLNTNESRTQVIDPPQRVAEVLFGLIMVLTFTCSLSVAEAGRDDVRAMLIGALGCNLAWGIIDGVFFMMSSLAEKGGALLRLLQLRQSGSPEAGRQVLADALPPLVASVMQPAELDAIQGRLRELPEPAHAKLEGRDWLGGLSVMLLVFLSTFPVAIPFMLMESAKPALRVSNAVAISLLFIAGCAYGRCIGRKPWLVGIGMVVLGSSLVAMAIPLGG